MFSFLGLAIGIFIVTALYRNHVDLQEIEQRGLREQTFGSREEAKLHSNIGSGLLIVSYAVIWLLAIFY